LKVDRKYPRQRSSSSSPSGARLRAVPSVNDNASQSQCAHRSGVSENRPAHIGKPSHKKRSRALGDAMLWLKPCNKCLFILVLNQPKANEGVHLMNVAPDGLDQTMQAIDIWINGIGKQTPFALDSPKQPIQQIEPRRIAMTYRSLCIRKKCLWHGHKTFVRGSSR